MALASEGPRQLESHVSGTRGREEDLETPQPPFLNALPLQHHSWAPSCRTCAWTRSSSHLIVEIGCTGCTGGTGKTSVVCNCCMVRRSTGGASTVPRSGEVALNFNEAKSGRLGRLGLTIGFRALQTRGFGVVDEVGEFSPPGLGAALDVGVLRGCARHASLA